jgi:hypothetical protein
MYLLVFHAYINEMHGSRSKISSKNLVRQRCAKGFNSGVKELIAPGARKTRYSADQDNFSVYYFQFIICCHFPISCYVVHTAEKARKTLPCSERVSNTRQPACAISQAVRSFWPGSVTLVVVFYTIEVKHEHLALGPLSVCVVGVSPGQILGCCLFLRLLQGKLSN